jgi:hypothetical protein
MVNIVTPLTAGTGSDTLVLSMSEDAWQGDAEFTVTVDGTQVGGIYTTTASHAAGSSQTFSLLGNWGSSTHAIGVSFINDAYGGTATTDRNLYIQQVSYDGVAATGGAAELASNGTSTFSVAATTPPAATTTATPVTTGTGSDTLVLSMSEDAWQGDAEFTVTVDGTQVGGIYTTTASHAAGSAQTFSLVGNWGSSAHAIGVSFINDAYGGTATTDRNLYIQEVSYDGVAATGGAAELASNGTSTFSIGATPTSATTPPVVTTTPSTPTPTPTVTPQVSAYYVAVGGSDNADGSAAHPFASLQRATLAMETGSIKTTYVAGGTYNQATTLNLTTADNGESFIGVTGQTAIIAGNLPTLMSLNGTSGATIEGLTFSGSISTPTSNGQGQLNLNGASNNAIIANHFMNAGGDGLLIEEGASNNTVSGNEIDNTADSSIELKDASNYNVIDSNVLNGTAALNTTGGGVFGHGIHNTVITHNIVENTSGMGIGILDFGSGTQNSNNLIQDNSLTNNDTNSDDSGAIYLLGRSDTNVATSVNMNFISEPNSNSANHTVGIYLDDYSSGVTVTNNIVSGLLSYDLQVHGGNIDQITNNIFNTGSQAAQVALIQSAPTDVPVGPLGTFNNDTMSGNLVVGTGLSGVDYAVLGTSPSSVAINNNDYTGGAGTNTVPDSSAKYLSQSFVNLAGGNYNLSGGTGASSIGFVQIDQSQMGTHPTGAHFYS